MLVGRNEDTGLEETEAGHLTYFTKYVNIKSTCIRIMWTDREYDVTRDKETQIL